MLKAKLGFKGERGYSAYEIAVQNGYIGSEQDWLATLGTSSHFEQDIEVYTTEEENEDTFALPISYTSDSFVEVYVNGLRLNTSEYTLDTTNSEVVLTTPLEVVGTKVEVIVSSMSTNNLPITDTIDSTSTNDTAAGTKAVYDALQLKVNTSDYTTAMAAKVNNSNFAVLNGTFNALPSDNPGQSYQKTTEELSYPEGFTNLNSVCIAIGLTRTDVNQDYKYKYDASQNIASNATGYTSGNFPRSLYMSPDGIDLNVYNWGSGIVELRYKVVLLKIPTTPLDIEASDLNQYISNLGGGE